MIKYFFYLNIDMDLLRLFYRWIIDYLRNPFHLNLSNTYSLNMLTSRTTSATKPKRKLN